VSRLIDNSVFRDQWAEEPYRYTLGRVWGPGPLVLWVLANPSTADALDDDPTCLRGMGFSRRWGFGGMVFVNLFAYRATDPGQLIAAARTGADVVGPHNDEVVRFLAFNLRFVVCAWGDCLRGREKNRVAEVREVLRTVRAETRCLGLTAKGNPKHPLMLPYTTKLEEWS
jgi:hypothetical protein